MEKSRRALAAVSAVVLALALVPACAARVDPNITPEQAKLRQLQRIALVTERVGVLVESLQSVEISLHTAGKIPRDDHRVIQLSLKIAAETVIDALERGKDLTRPEADRRDAIAQALKAVDRLITEGLKPVLDAQSRLELQLIAASISGLLLTLQLVT